MTIGQVKAKPCCFALCLTDVFYIYFVFFETTIFFLSFSSQRLVEWEVRRRQSSPLTIISPELIIRC